MKKETTSWIIRVIIAALFIVSAFAKLYPSPYFAISTFEVKQLYPLGFSEGFAPYFSRILIGIEFALGIAILINHHLKKITIPATILLLVVFILQLSYETFFSGNSGNCGCFGELIPMTPVEAIIKNIIAVGLLIWLLKLLPSDSKSNIWVLFTILLLAILSLFMLAPMQQKTKQIDNSFFNDDNVLGTEIDTTLSTVIPTIEKAIEAENTKAEAKTVKEEVKIDEPSAVKSSYTAYFKNIAKDKKILCFFAPGCDHCQDTAKELHEMKLKDKSFPDVYIIFMDEEVEKIPEFFKIAGTKYPYQVIDIISFWTILGNNRDTPGVKYLWNGNEIKFYDGINDNKFSGSELKKTIKKNYSEIKK
ncbi:MauE/DoxX family redox-associated membrane protein [Flavobacterium ardleyense]|uniref:MauE/DoxX family redox-associated membrane protein n=1 Tax=Flavobacterium ardleyense TaxID=2038737 RepID=A0ABW5Z8Z8_9FLAO